MSLEQEAQQYANQLKELVTKFFKNLQELGLYKGKDIKIYSKLIVEDYAAALISVTVEGFKAFWKIFDKQYDSPEAKETKEQIVKEALRNIFKEFRALIDGVSYGRSLISDSLEYDIQFLKYAIDKHIIPHLDSSLKDISLFGDYARSKGLQNDFDSIVDIMNNSLLLARKISSIDIELDIKHEFGRKYHEYLLEQP